MKRFMSLFTPALLLLCLFTGSASGFDGQRKGFILGGGVGLGMTSVKQSIDDGVSVTTGESETKFAFGTDFRIGWGIDSLWEVFYFNDLSWFTAENIFGNKITFATGVGGIGVRRYFGPPGAAPFVTAGVGLSTWDTPFEEGGKAWWGVGVMAGGGYEFSPHWSVEANLSYGEPKEDELNLTFTTKAFSAGVKVIATAF